MLDRHCKTSTSGRQPNTPYLDTQLPRRRRSYRLLKLNRTSFLMGTLHMRMTRGIVHAQYVIFNLNDEFDVRKRRQICVCVCENDYPKQAPPTRMTDPA